ncbi:MAG: hypothetical protein ACK42Y_03960 [Candidatus Thermochlorobacter sp.]
MPKVKHTLSRFVIASLFLVSTVCGILDDQNIDRSYQNFTHYHACFATNCPICGAQYQVQDDTTPLQKGIVLASDELCAVLSLHYTLSWHRLDFACEAILPNLSPPDPRPQDQTTTPLRI